MCVPGQAGARRDRQATHSAACSAGGPAEAWGQGGEGPAWTGQLSSPGPLTLFRPVCHLGGAQAPGKSASTDGTCERGQAWLPASRLGARPQEAIHSLRPAARAGPLCWGPVQGLEVRRGRRGQGGTVAEEPAHLGGRATCSYMVVVVLTFIFWSNGFFFPNEGRLENSQVFRRQLKPVPQRMIGWVQLLWGRVRMRHPCAHAPPLSISRPLLRVPCMRFSRGSFYSCYRNGTDGQLRPGRHLQ